MIGQYIEDPIKALEKAKKWLRGNNRPHILLGRTAKGYLLIDPRFKDGHYCQIVSKLYRKQT